MYDTGAYLCTIIMKNGFKIICTGIYFLRGNLKYTTFDVIYNTSTQLH